HDVPSLPVRAQHTPPGRPARSVGRAPPAPAHPRARGRGTVRSETRGGAGDPRAAQERAGAPVIGLATARVGIPSDLTGLTTRASEPSPADLRRLGLEPGGVEAIWRAVEALF